MPRPFCNNCGQWVHEFTGDCLNACRQRGFAGPTCARCGGAGEVNGTTGGSEGVPLADVVLVCPVCRGSGREKQS